MSDSKNSPTETSPLISKSTSSAIEASFGTLQDGVSAESGPEGWAEESWARRFSLDGSPLSRQVTAGSEEDRSKQYEGIPELKARMHYIFPALAIGVFLAAADQTIIVSSYGRIGSELNALNETSWIATGYFLSLTSFQPLYGKLSDIFSRKSCLLFAYVVFGLGCLFCGLAQDINQLIGARIFAGIGGGGMAVCVSILLSDIIPLKERGTWQGYVNVIYATGAATGAPLGGILADGIGWRWAFLAQTPFCLIAFVAVLVTLKMPDKADNLDWKKKLRRVDFLGAIVLIIGVFALLLGLDRGSNVSWSSRSCLIPLCLAPPVFLLFAYTEMKIASEPIAPGHILFKGSLIACFLCNLFSFAGWLSGIFFLALYCQAVMGYTASQAGLLLIPSIVGGVTGSLIGGFTMQKTGKYYWITAIAYCNLVIGLIIILLCSGVVVSSTVGTCLGATLCGFSNGIGVTTTLIGLIANADREDQAIATACSYLFRSMGSTVGLSLTSTVANQTLRSALQRQLVGGADAAKIIEGVRASLSYLDTLDPTVRKIVVKCYAKSIRAAFGFDIALVFGAAFSAWFIKEKSLGN